MIVFERYGRRKGQELYALGLLRPDALAQEVTMNGITDSRMLSTKYCS